MTTCTGCDGAGVVLEAGRFEPCSMCQPPPETPTSERALVVLAGYVLVVTLLGAMQCAGRCPPAPNSHIHTHEAMQKP